MMLVTEATNDEGRADFAGYAEDDATVRISNPDAENGYNENPGPLDWLNSARITTSKDEDAVHCIISVGDPRGGFCFTVRRLESGEMLIHVPTPGEGMAHVEIKELHPGTLQLVHHDGSPMIFEREVVKHCESCGDKIESPQLAADEDELCADCAPDDEPAEGDEANP